MRLRPIRFLLPAVFLAFSLASELNAQTTTSGGLTGVVIDQSNAVVPNATVEIKDNAKGIAQSTRTDREGVYRFFFLAPARYALTVTHDGFREERRTVNVVLGPPVSVNVTLEIAQPSFKVTVTDEVPLIQAENGDASATVNQKQISEVPNPGNMLFPQTPDALAKSAKEFCLTCHAGFVECYAQIHHEQISSVIRGKVAR